MSESKSTPAAPAERENLFPSISQVATETDARADDSGEPRLNAEGGEEAVEEQQMQEIESLCMRCHEQVCPRSQEIIRFRS
jgi:hypothetical protein